MDASGDSLVLENDADLHYYRRIIERYGTNDVLVLTYSARDNLFSPDSIAELNKLRDELRQLEGVGSVTSILDVPLVLSTNISLSEVADRDNIKTLENSDVDKNTVVKELNENPLYRGRLLSSDEKTTAILLNLPVDQAYRELLQQRYDLREKKYQKTLTPEEEKKLHDVSLEYRKHLTRLMHEENLLIESVRAVMGKHQGHG